ncbi:hypothetical protein COU57_03495 [Candidatus Pacearchaeota archaeon CG10_big_fil_rev_8_21_14_0_10_32_14]|nr:MAG: hypothetical protein COU57_03495 [Candidatus Pacearchaeota archaeon CG10_big_fil_rev_8_21_14_0_10_32_14]
MTKRILLIGGPGCGKSSLILELERLGEYIIKESAEDVIRLEQAKGTLKPWTKNNFQEKILKLQIQREKNIPKNIERVFIDRGIPDGLAYIKSSSHAARLIKNAIKRYNKIFFIENLGTTEKNKIRKENFKQAIKLENKIKRIYESLGYKLEIIKPADVNQRVKDLLSRL